MVLLTGNRTSDTKGINYSYNQTVNRQTTLQCSLITALYSLSILRSLSLLII